MRIHRPSFDEYLREEEELTRADFDKLDNWERKQIYESFDKYLKEENGLSASIMRTGGWRH